MLKQTLIDLLKAMQDSQPDLTWALDTGASTVRIDTAKGAWIFTAPPGRRASRYLAADSRRQRQHKVYPEGIPFAELALLAFMAEIITLARLTAQEDWQYVYQLAEALAGFQLWLERGQVSGRGREGNDA
jgi:hypothetical protein